MTERILLEDDEAGAAEWLPYARQRLKRLKQVFKGFCRKSLAPTSDVRIHIGHMSGIDSIHITHKPAPKYDLFMGQGTNSAVNFRRFDLRSEPKVQLWSESYSWSAPPSYPARSRGNANVSSYGGFVYYVILDEVSNIQGSLDVVRFPITGGLPGQTVVSADSYSLISDASNYGGYYDGNLVIYKSRAYLTLHDTSNNDDVNPLVLVYDVIEEDSGPAWELLDMFDIPPNAGISGDYLSQGSGSGVNKYGIFTAHWAQYFRVTGMDFSGTVLWDTILTLNDSSYFSDIEVTDDAIFAIYDFVAGHSVIKVLNTNGVVIGSLSIPGRRIGIAADEDTVYIADDGIDGEDIVIYILNRVNNRDDDGNLISVALEDSGETIPTTASSGALHLMLSLGEIVNDG